MLFGGLCVRFQGQSGHSVTVLTSKVVVGLGAIRLIEQLPRGSRPQHLERALDLVQAPPNGKQIGGSHPIYLPLLNLRDDGEVFGCRFDLSMRKTELRPSTLDQIGHTSRTVLQIIENVAADQSEMRKLTHDT